MVSFWFKSVFRAIFHCRSPQAGIMKLEWWEEANFWKKPEVRDNLMVIGTPKLFVWKHGGLWVKFSLWPFRGWIPRPTKAIWKYFFDWQLQHYGGPAVSKGNLNKHDLNKFINTTDAFMTEILQIWSEISYEANVNSTDHFLSLPLWHNSLKWIDNRPIYYKLWNCKGIQNVTDLFKDRNTFLSSHELTECYNVKANFLVLHSLKSSLKSLRESRSLSNTSSQSFLQSFLQAKKSKKHTKVVYERLVTIKQKSPFASQEKWLADCEFESHETIDWKSVYLLLFKCTQITKLIMFQLTLLHWRLATNSFLKKVGIKQSDLCTFCKTEEESPIHLFWSCGVTSHFWQ